MFAKWGGCSYVTNPVIYQSFLFKVENQKMFTFHFLSEEYKLCTVRNGSTKGALNDFASWPAEFTKELLLRNYLLPGILGYFI